MVLINEKKYACETCIKGHRSSACQHTERPLFEIKKKGRPVTQCEHCRELRKTKQVHVKCMCGGKEDSSAPKETKKKGNKIPDTPAFPNGLPKGVEADPPRPSPVKTQDPLPELEKKEQTCNCDNTGECSCCTPRKSPPSKNRNNSAGASKGHFKVEEEEIVVPKSIADSKPKRGQGDYVPSKPVSTHVLARIAELRPVLPRPEGPLHDISSGIAHGSGIRHHTHDHMFFSPYGRAHEQVHAVEHELHGRAGSHDEKHREGHHLEHGHRRQSSREHSPKSEVLSSPPPLPDAWQYHQQGLFPSMCGCGDNCSCPGCIEHNPETAATRNHVDAFGSCVNPNGCSACLDCTILSLPPSLPPDTVMSLLGEDPTHSHDIDEWIRLVSVYPHHAEMPHHEVQQQHQEVPQQQLIYSPPIPWSPEPPSSEAPSTAEHSPNRVLDCKCPPGLCTCETAFCGYCQDCVCEEVDYDATEQLTYALALERARYTPEDEREDNGHSVSNGSRNGYLTAPSLNHLSSHGRSDSPSSASDPGFVASVAQMRLRPTLSNSSSYSLSVPPSNAASGNTSANATPPLSRTVSALPSPNIPFSQSSPELHLAHSTYERTHYPVSNADSSSSDQSPPPSEKFEHREVSYALSNADSEYSHEEFEYDPRFDYPLTVASTENLSVYANSSADSEPSLEDLEKYEYDPSLDQIQLQVSSLS